MSTLLALFETSGLVDTIFSVVGTLLYPLFSIIFVLIRGVQDLFYSFAGIGTAWSQGQPITHENTGLETDTGILYYLMTRPLVKNMIYSMIILALFLIVIFTTLAFIKNAYSAKPKNWKEIVSNAIKGLGNFILLPVCCLLGVWFGNILLQAINGATSNGGSASMDRKLFVACAYNANVFRASNSSAGEATWSNIQNLAQNSYMLDDPNVSFWDAKGGESGIEKHLKQGEEDELDENYYEYYATIVDQIYSETDKSIHWYLSVGEFYSLWQFNYLVLIVGGIFMLYVLGSLAFAMVRRMFILLALLVISPGVCALYPLDEGNAVKSWSGEVKKQVISAYGAVAGMNIFFSILPLFDQISWTTNMAWGLADILEIFILVVGLQCVKELISMFSGFVGGEDAYSKGSGLMKSTTSKIGGTVTKTAGVFARASGAKAAGGSFLGSLAKQGLAGGAKMAGLDYKSVKGAYKDGKEHAFDARKERYEAKEAKDKASKAREALRKIYNEDGELISSESSKKKFGRKMADFFGGEIGIGSSYTKTQYENAMKAAANDPKLQKAITEEYVRSQNRDAGFMGNIVDNVKGAHKEIFANDDKSKWAKGAAGAFYAPYILGKTMNPSEVKDVEKQLEAYNASVGLTKKTELMETEGAAIGTLKAKMLEAEETKSAFVSGKESDIKDGNDLLKSATIEQLKMAADGTADGSDERIQYNKALAALRAKELNDAVDEAAKTLADAGKDFASSIASAAESQKGQTKELYTQLSEALKKTAVSGKNEDLVNAIKEVKEAINADSKKKLPQKDLENLIKALSDAYINKKP